MAKLGNLRPDIFVPSVADITPELLDRFFPGVMGVMFDLDNTLAPHHEYAVSDDKIKALIAIRAAGKKLGIISNAETEALTTNVVLTAGSIGNKVGSEIYTVTSFEVDGKYKPHHHPFDKMSEKTGVPKSQLCYVGDQLLKDVYGSNKAGYAGSILVAPCSRRDNPKVKYLQRPLEAVIRPFIQLPLLTKSF